VRKLFSAGEHRNAKEVFVTVREGNFKLTYNANRLENLLTHSHRRIHRGGRGVRTPDFRTEGVWGSVDGLMQNDKNVRIMPMDEKLRRMCRCGASVITELQENNVTG
jgi:hypothetical protein